MVLTETIQAYLEHRATQVADNTLRTEAASLHRLVREIGDMPLHEVDERAIDWFVMGMSEMEPSSRNLRVRKVKAFFDWAHRRGLVVANPVDRRPEREPERAAVYIPREQFPMLLTASGTPRDRMIVALGLYLFLRSSEIQSLRVGDWKIDPGWMDTVQHKTGTRDRMPVCEELDRELRAYWGWYLDNCPTVTADSFLVPSIRVVTVAPFGYPGNGRFRRTASPLVTHITPDRPTPKPHLAVQRALAGVGIPSRRQGGHTLRRSGARALFDELREREGIDGALQQVKVMLHHKNVAQTEAYIGVNPERERRDSLLRGRRMFHTDGVDNVIQMRR